MPNYSHFHAVPMRCIVNQADFVLKVGVLSAIESGERAKIVVDFSDGRDVILKSFPEAGIVESFSSLSEATTNGHFDLLEIRLKPPSRYSQVIPNMLNRIARLERDRADVERTMVMGGMVINGKPVDMGKIDNRI